MLCIIIGKLISSHIKVLLTYFNVKSNVYDINKITTKHFAIECESNGVLPTPENLNLIWMMVHIYQNF